MNDKTLKSLIVAIRKAVAESGRLTGVGPSGSKLHPPAPAKSVAAFEKKTGIPFPPSYRSFLALHNGWEDYLDAFTLIGVSGAHTKRALESIERSCKIFRIEWEGKHGKATEDHISAFEARFTPAGKTEEDAHLYLPSKLVFGTDHGGALLVFDPRRVGANGEYVAYERNQTGGLVSSHDSFVAMLEHHLATTEKEIARLKKHARG